MNIKNKKIIGSIYFFSFFKRAFICFLCIILCFNVVCKPKKTYGATLGVAVTWGLSEYLAALLASAGIALTVDTFCRGLGLYGGDDEVTEEEALQWCKNNISIDGDNNVVFTDDAKAFVNEYLLGTYNDSVTMVYRYPVQMQHVSAETFPNKNVYDAFIALCQAYPDCYIVTGSSNTFNYRTCWYLDTEGVEIQFPGLMSRDDFYLFGVIPSPFCGVGASLDLASTSTQFYNDNWETSFPVKTFCFTTDGRTLYSLPDCYNTGLYFQQFNIDDFPSLDVVDTVQPLSFYGTSFATFSSNSYSTSLSARTAYSASQMAINVYKSEADMKKDIGSQIIGNYIPDYYTGTPNYNITQSEVNNIVNNYYGDNSGGGSGSGSDDSGGSSGGSGIIDGLGKLFGAIGNIIDKLFGFVLGLLSKVVEFFASILEMFTDTLTKLIDIIPAGFNEFLAAMFPYIPEEMITIAQFIMLVSAIGCVVALFKR